MENKIATNQWNDIIEWDTVNWKRAIEYWESFQIDFKNKYVLDIGARNGGLSLFAALNGGIVTCSDIPGTSFEKAKLLHKKYNVEDKIEYKYIDATNMNIDKKYDIIMFKSVLGGIGYNNRKDRQEIAINNIYNALRPDGLLLFTENLKASKIHQYFRRVGTKWGGTWRYIETKELDEMLEKYHILGHREFGFLGSFGRTNKQRVLLGKIDSIFDKFISDRCKYICSYVCQK